MIIFSSRDNRQLHVAAGAHRLVGPSFFATLGKRNLVQYAVELSPDLIPLGAGEMAICAFRFWPDLGRLGLRLEMIEIEVSPASGVSKALGVLDGHIGAIERGGEKPHSRRLSC